MTTTAITDHGPLRTLRNFTAGSAVVALSFVAVELALVPVVNRSLDRANADYVVRIDDLDLEPWRGAFSVDGLTVRNRAAPEGAPLLDVEHIDVSIDGPALLRGIPVGVVRFSSPTARVVASRAGGEHPLDQLAGLDSSVVTSLTALVPVAIDRIIVDDGALYLVSAESFERDLRIGQIEIDAENLSNSEQLATPLFASVQGSGRADGVGALRASLRLQPGAQQPTFELDAAVTRLPLASLDTLGLDSPGFDDDGAAGTLDLSTTIAARDGRFRATIRPRTHDEQALGQAVDVRAEARHRVLGTRLVAGIIDGASRVLKSPAAKSAGSVDDDIARGRVDMVTAIYVAVKTRFVEAVRPFLDGTFRLPDLKNVVPGAGDGADGLTADDGDVEDVA